jgi:hypothetical protein
MVEALQVWVIKVGTSASAHDVFDKKFNHKRVGKELELVVWRSRALTLTLLVEQGA